MQYNQLAILAGMNAQLVVSAADLREFGRLRQQRFDRFENIACLAVLVVAVTIVLVFRGWQ